VAVDLGTSDWASPSRMKRQNDVTNGSGGSGKGEVQSSLVASNAADTGLHLRHRHNPHPSPLYDDADDAAKYGFRRTNTQGRAHGPGHAHSNSYPHQHHATTSVRQRINHAGNFGSSGGRPNKCKPILQFLLLSTLIGYLLFLYTAHYRYTNRGQEDIARFGHDYLDGNHDRAPIGSSDSQYYDTYRDSSLSSANSHHPPASSSAPLLPFAFTQLSTGLSRDFPPYEEPSTPAFRRAEEWAANHWRELHATQSSRKERRRGRTSPPSNLVDKSGELPTTPHWYQLDHLAPETIASSHQRWHASNNKKDESDLGNDILESTSFPLCGAHVKEAATYPQNYFPPSSAKASSASSSDPHDQHYHHHHPLGPTSRVLITGILSPLGMHLTLALHRQCNVTNFLGLDTEIPNDPLARLEQQERLAVLMSELGDLKNFKQLQVPFLGLEGKTTRKSPTHWMESKAREDRLVELSRIIREGRGGSDAAGHEKRGFDYGKSFQTYGVDLNPGMDPHGAGALDILLEYRPTHVVHLAGTQADSLLNPKNAHQMKVATQKEEEEDDILTTGISSRPHFFEMRMGTTGMEQLLSGVVAQTMLPPRYGKESDIDGKPLSESDSNKMMKPHIVYASSYDAHYFAETSSRLNRNLDSENNEGKNENSLGWNPSSLNSSLRPPRGLHGVSRLIDEILASTYFALHGVTSVGLRLDTIHGPRGFGVPSTSVPIYNVNRIRNGGGVSPDVDLAETAVRRLYRKWMAELKKLKQIEENTNGQNESNGIVEELQQLNLIEEAGWLHAAHDPRDFVFVEDAVNAIIAAMQYSSTGNSPTTFNIGSGEMESLSSISDEIQYLTSDDSTMIKTDGKSLLSKSVIDVEQSSAARSASLDSNEYLRWSATTSLQHGVAKLLAWHLDRALPFFPPAPKPDKPDEASEVALFVSKPLDGEDILSKRSIKACVNSDDPTCLYEPHTALPCASECSTKTCIPSVFDSVISLSRDVTEGCEVVLYTMSLGADIDSLDLRTVYNDGEEFEKWGEPSVCTMAYIPSDSTLTKNIIGKVPPASLAKMDISAESDLKTKVKVLNGHLVHQGWVLIFVDNAIEPLTAEDVYLPKITPGLLFHSSVFRALFVDENFNISPTPEDAQFLTSEMARGKVKKRTVMGPDAKGRTVKYKLPEEPQRRAVLLVAPMKEHPADGDKINLRDVTKLMMKEIGLKPNEHEPKEIRAQREYYERAKSLINSFDLRTLLPVARHKIEIKDFIRSRWVIHDMRLEEAHQLRCEWYREHVKWNTHLDQLSFSYVMAKRELTRKIITEQPLETESEKLTLLQMVINTRSDAKEWHPIFSGEGTRLPIHHSQISPEEVPQNLFDLPDNEIDEVDTVIEDNDESSNTYYVRIMSDKVMLDCRKKWTKARDERRKIISFQRKKQRQQDQQKQNQ